MKYAHRARRSVSSIATLALLAGGAAVLASPAPAQAAPTTITNAELRWELNKESISAAYAPGTWNLFSAGKLGNPGAGGQTLKSTDEGATWANGTPAGWKNTDGNVTILDKAANGTYAPTTWAGTRTDSAGTTMTTGNGVTSENLLSLTNGTGTVDPDTNTGTLQWTGDFTVVYYSGMSFFYVSNPKLTVTNGVGTLTATLSGYGSDMNDQTQWVPLTPTTVTLGDVTGVDLTETGLTTTPKYLGVNVTVPAGGSPQSTSNAATAGSFPQSFVDFQSGVGTASYWYSSGGAADVRKPTTPLNVSWAPAGQAGVTVSKTTLLPNGAQEVTVQGTGFDPALATSTGANGRPPAAGRPAGTYVSFGKFAQSWKPSAGAASTNRVATSTNWALAADDMASVGGPTRGAIELRPDGTFTATLTIDKAAIDASVAGKTNAADLVNYGIYTYAGGGAVQSAYETYTPITFAKAIPSAAITASPATYGADVPVSVALTGDTVATGDVTLKDGDTTVGTATLADGKASFTLVKPAAGTHELSLAYPGDANTQDLVRTGTVTVAKAVPAVGVTATGGQSGAPVTVTVTVPADATGNVVLKDGAATVGNAAIAAGSATFTLAGLAAGEHALVASYAGDTNHEAASGVTRVSVTAAAVDEPVAGIAKVSWGTRPTAGKRGTAVIKVSELAEGKATAVVRTVTKAGKGKKVKALTARIKNGKVTFKLPKLGKGKYALVVKVPGNDDVAKAKVTRTFRVK
jgi:hypothetical protein